MAKYNVARWRALARSGAVFTRPLLDLDEDSARDYLDPQRRLGDVAGKDVLCLASGGGQQSAAFALLGANVTVVDISDAQLRADALAAAHYGFKLKLIEGDMRDLSPLSAESFDIVWHTDSLNFVPDARAVFREVARVLRSGGIYHFMCANPFFLGLGAKDWNGHGYTLALPYIDGAEIACRDESWIYRDGDACEATPWSREYRHTLGTLVSGLIEEGFLLASLSEQNYGTPDFAAEPGAPEHLTSIAPPWLIFRAIYRADILRK